MTQKDLFAIQSQEPDFQAERLSGIGGSDAGAVYSVGMKCRRRTLYEKRRMPQDFSSTSAPELERGIFVEPVLRSLYEAKTGRKVKTLPLARHPQYEWMIVHVDGETTSPQFAGPGYVEFKCVNRFVFDKFKKAGLRDEYILQVQHGIAVKNYQWGSFGILCLDPWQFAYFDVKRDQALIDKLIEDEEAFWVQIQNGPMPEALSSKDKRCATCPYRRSCQGAALADQIPNFEEGKEIVPMPQLQPLIQEVVELGEIVSEAEELRNEAKEKLKAAIGKAYGVSVPGYRALYPTAYPERWDTKALTGLLATARELITEDLGFDFDNVEKWRDKALSWLESFCKSKKEGKPERSLRIYPTGD